MFLPDCCNKCDCTCGVLPYTITAKFSNFGSKMAYGGGVGFGYSAISCESQFGGGAQVRISAPGGDLEDAGPITDAFVTLPGSCYAEHGRVAPTLSVTSPSAKADFTVTLEEFTSKCRAAWKVSEIKVDNGGDLADGQILSIAAASGDVTVKAAAAKVTVADESVGATVTEPGEYYRRAKSARDIPVLRASAGHGIRLSPSLSYNGGNPPTWSVRGLSILYAGEGSEAGKSAVTFSLAAGTQEVAKAEGYVEIEDGKAVSATVQNGGSYYRDTDVSPIVADVTFEPVGSVGGLKTGTGGLLRGVVDDNPTSRTFGQVVSVEVEEAGEGYLGWQWTPDRCVAEMNDRSIVLRASNTTPLVRTCVDACFGSGAVIEPCFRVEPRMVGSIDGLGVVADVFLSKNEGYPATWGVSRVVATGVGPVFEVGQQILVSFAVPSPADPANFYSVTYTNSDNVARTKQEVAAVVEVAETTPADPDIYGPDYPTGWLKAVTISQPGAYYQESTEWDGVSTPLHHVRMLRQGAGYAKKRRTMPTLAAGNSGEMPVTVSEASDSCGLPYWKLESIELSGSGYTEGSALKISTAAKAEQTARVAVHTREEPTVSASVAGGSATLSVTLAKTAPSVAGWSDFFDTPLGVQSAVWGVSGVQVQASGSGYPPNSTVNVSFATPHSGTGAQAVAATDENGGIESVSVTKAGSYFRNQGIPQEVTIVRRGVYYTENDDLEPYVGLNEIRVVQTAPSEGKGAVVTAKVVTDTSSASFGKIESVEVDEPGGDYLIRSGPTDCQYLYTCPEAGQSILAVVGNGLVKISLRKLAISSDAPPETEDTDVTRWDGFFVSSDEIETCGVMPTGKYVSVYDGVSGEITLTSNGKYDGREGCCWCPCSISGTPLDLFPCGIQSITVEVDIQVEPDEEDADRCPNLNATLTLAPEAVFTPNAFWYKSRLGDRWAIEAALQCSQFTGNRHQISLSISPLVSEPDSPSPCGLGAPMFGAGLTAAIPLPASRNAAGDRCCPEGTEYTINHYGATINVTVTIVEFEEE